MSWYGLWAVSNEWKDVSDVASIKEQRSYALLERPYRFLQAIDKKKVDQETARDFGGAAASLPAEQSSRQRQAAVLRARAK
jgi:hypothetical protein